MTRWTIDTCSDKQKALLAKAAAKSVRKEKIDVVPADIHLTEYHMVGSKAKYNPESFNAFLLANKIPFPQYEYRFHSLRKWRLDMAWPDYKLALEVQGGIWTNGRHTRGAALLKEWEKLNELACLGWRLLYCQPRDLFTTETAEIIRRALYR